MSYRSYPRIVNSLQRATQNLHRPFKLPRRHADITTSVGSRMTARLGSLLLLNDTVEPICVCWTLEGSVV